MREKVVLFMKEKKMFMKDKNPEISILDKELPSTKIIM